MSKDFIGFRVTPDVKERLEAEAEKEMRPLSHLIRDRVLKPAEDAPIPHETQHDKANKAKVRKAVENGESYEVKIEPVKSYEQIQQPESFKASDEAALRAKAMELVRTKGLSFRAAIAEVRRNG